MEQAIRFTSVSGRRVAWASVGDGPPLVIGGWWMSHLELDWEDERFRALIGALAEHRTVVRYDRPGTGLSADDDAPPATLGDEVDVLAGVAGELGEAIDAFAGSAGGPVVMAYAVANLEAVRRLVVYGSYANGSRIAPPEDRQAMVALVRSHWGLGSKVLSDVFIPTASAEERSRFVAFQRQSASAEIAARSLESVYSFDVESLLPRLSVPTTVLHRREDRAIPFELGRELAAEIPGATFLALEGSDHLPWHGDAGAVARALLKAIGIAEPAIDLPGAQSAPVEVDLDGELSEREVEVLRLVARGLSDREIAEQLVLSPHTVHRHVANIRTKLRQPSRAAAAAYAARRGLV